MMRSYPSENCFGHCDGRGAVAQKKLERPESFSLNRSHHLQLEHILLRPDTYIGSVEQTTENMWVFDTVQNKMVPAIL